MIPPLKKSFSKHTSIRKRLILSFITIMFLIGMSVIFLIRGFSEYQRIDDINHNLGASIKYLHITLRGVNQSLLTEGTFPARELATQGAYNYKIQLDKLKLNIKDDNETAILQEIKNETSEFFTALKKFINLGWSINEQNSKSIMLSGQLDSRGEKLLSKLNELNNIIRISGEKKLSSLLINTISTAIIILSSLGLILFLLYRGIVNPIKYLEVLRKIMNDTRDSGNLNHKIDIQSVPEIAYLAEDFNELMNSLRESVGQAALTASQVAANAGQLASTIVQTSNGLNNQQSQTIEATSLIHEMESISADITAKTQMATKAAKEASSEALSGKGTVTEAIISINDLSKDMDNTVSVVNQLGTASTEISTIIDVINNIAEQTNLLALNAAIEAARAGESGRGFAVVADEVRTLATRTHNSTKQIQDLILNLNNLVQSSVSAIEKDKKSAERSVLLANKSGDSLNNITAAVNTITNMNVQIENDAEKQNVTSINISQNIESIGNVIGLTSQATAIVSTVSMEMETLAENLNNQIGHFNPEFSSTTPSNQDDSKVDYDNTELF